LKETIKNEIKIKFYFKKTLLYGPPGGGGEFRPTLPPLVPLVPFLGTADTNATNRAIVNNFKFMFKNENIFFNFGT
jgi:hypothetical protein